MRTCIYIYIYIAWIPAGNTELLSGTTSDPMPSRKTGQIDALDRIAAWHALLVLTFQRCPGRFWIRVWIMDFPKNAWWPMVLFGHVHFISCLMLRILFQDWASCSSLIHTYESASRWVWPWDWTDARDWERIGELENIKERLLKTTERKRSRHKTQWEVWRGSLDIQE